MVTTDLRLMDRAIVLIIWHSHVLTGKDTTTKGTMLMDVHSINLIVFFFVIIGLTFFITLRNITWFLFLL